jgi:mannose-6-phosphate isomerase-like protein (cupin superfamily)
MKKILYVLVAFIILIGGYSIFAFQTKFEFDPEFDLGLDTPDNLIRTIYNPIFDDTVTFVKFSKETGGAYTLLEIDLAAGGGNATHLHERFSETFRAISGDLGVEHQGQDLVLPEGQSFKIAPGETHRFYNPGEERIRFQVKIEPGSAGFEKALYLMYGLTQDGYAKENGLFKELSHTALFVKLSDTKVPGLLNLMNPVLKSTAQKMEASGEAQELLQKYYYSKVE